MIPTKLNDTQVWDLLYNKYGGIRVPPNQDHDSRRYFLIDDDECIAALQNYVWYLRPEDVPPER
jgi:hypothetical protein